MKKKYLKTMRECQNYTEIADTSIIDKVFSDEMIMETVYKLQQNLAEYLTKQDYYNSLAELTVQEINRQEQLLNQ